ncbi:pseudouridine synthase [Dokdonia sp. MED134]|jgi:23S rRNA pseudouridine2605 synthase|uniref:Pseudouridine synthase n=1 Tax=Dokdonia genika TaxID=308113 RepID=A0ABV9L9F1_9FLAO|nr:pseudouridine synthase [Dokdonia sp. MED134]AOE05741.1 ribosomal large subunit pseudouridine synthase B [uncultured bacterium]EAQ38268.1 pseudouridylate synthase [Dokdonia sp. MED134]MDE0598336.1 S4 domain-containing protein [Dokdonia donghaensis]
MSRGADNRGKGKPSGRSGAGGKQKSGSRGTQPVRKQGGRPTAKAKDKAFDAPKKQTQRKKDDGTMRLNKYIANSGVCSRREADMYISIGQVTVNGKVINEMGYQVKIEDDVRFDGRRINPEAKAYVLLNKPKGFATTTSNDKGNTVMDLVAGSTKSRIQPIGRLGRNAMGLLLFTNDDELVQRFTNSKKGVDKLYHIELSNNLKAADAERIREGLKIGGKTIMVEEISFVDGAPKKEVGLRIKNTGNSIIRTIFEHLNYEVVRVDCVTIAGLTKKDLPRGHWRHLTKQEVINLKNG